MNWIFDAFLSAIAAGATAVLAEIGVRDVPSNLGAGIALMVMAAVLTIGA